MKKVCIDISQLAHPGGVATYTYNLAKGIQINKEFEIVLFYSSLRKPYRGDLKNIKNFRLPPTLFEVLFNKVRNVGIEKFVGPIDLLHSSDWIQPPTKGKKVTTYHDLVPLLYPEWSHPKIVAVHKRRLAIVESEIDMVIAVSEATKADLLKISKIPSEKIVVIPEAADATFKPQSEKAIQDLKKKYDLPDNYLLAIGGVGERRNLKRVREAAKGYNLVISGVTIPRVSKEELPALYAGSTALVYPSLYEGFGLPILEAMSCGTPVITSNVSSMPEVGGEAVLYVDPNDSEDIKKKIDRVTSDKSLREQMIKKGFKQSQKFSWDKCIQETTDVYKKLLND